MSPDEFIAQWHDPSPTVIMHTSGSTGKPKTIVAEKERMASSARATCRFLGLRPGDTALLCMSPDYVGGKMMIVRSIVCGLRLTTIEPTGHPMANCTDNGYDLVAMVPLQVYNTMNSPSERAKLARCRNVIIGGGAIDAQLEQQLRQMPNAIYSTYGMTETLSHIALRRLSGVEADQWYTPMDGVDISLTDDGMITIDAPAICPTTIVTNDIGQMHTDGRRFRVLGRRDNVICSGGVKIQIEEVEAKLGSSIHCPFMITKRPDPKFGEVVVMLHQHSNLPLETLCDDLLERYERPKAYIEIDSLPCTPNGKPDRAEAAKIAQNTTFSPQIIANVKQKS